MLLSPVPSRQKQQGHMPICQLMPLPPLTTFLHLALSPCCLTCMYYITGCACPLASENNGKFDQEIKGREKRSWGICSPSSLSFCSPKLAESLTYKASCHSQALPCNPVSLGSSYGPSPCSFRDRAGKEASVLFPLGFHSIHGDFPTPCHRAMNGPFINILMYPI